MSKSAPPKPPPDADTSRNQYIPSFIAAKPFYANSLDDSDYLQHQRNNAEPKDTLDKAKWYDRGKKAGPAATKYRKGACENCGSMSHKTKECLSRPRKTGAKYTGADIQADEHVSKVSLGWDAKRDRWNGYDASEYTQVVQDYNDLEAMKKANSTPNPDEADGDRIAEETDMGRSQPTSTRQLRLREDTAKYLIDLNPDTSGTYDPKTRSMDTSAPKAIANEVDVSDGFIRKSEAEAFERAQKYAWETQESALPNAQKLHLQANPTEGAVLLKKKEAADAEAKAAKQKYFLEHYGTAPPTGNGDASKTKPKPGIISSERYVEYDSTGKIKGLPETIPRSKYAEDVYQNNHTSVWGSWWRNFEWGYACCHSTTKNSYCTGEEGKVAFEEAEGLRTGQGLLTNGGDAEGDAGDEGARMGEGADIETATAEQAEKLSLEQNGDDIAERKDEADADTSKRKKRTIAELSSGVTEEEMESYKRSKMAADDPMREMLGRDEIVDR